jgi:hypothetical protein
MKVVSIKYIKHSGEYNIKTRDCKTGKTAITFSNRLATCEMLFARNAIVYENNDFIIWAK